MTDSVARLRRLHTLRCRLADAAAADHERVVQQVHAADGVLRDLEQVKRSATLQNSADAHSPWRERVAQMQAATCQQASWMERRQQCLEAKDAAALRQRTAVQEREQVGRILERRHLELAADRARREQARLDDLFATARVRSAMTTGF